MTEEEWFASTDPVPMVEFVRGKVSDRRLRLFALTCCRRIWGLSTDPAIGAALAIGERLVDTGGMQSGAAVIRVPAGQVYIECGGTPPVAPLALPSGEGGELVHVRIPDPDLELFLEFLACRQPGDWTMFWEFFALSVGPKVCAALLRDVFRYPSRPLVLRTEWLYLNGATVRQIAEGIHAAQAFDRLPFLADALEDAGCHEEELLRHCRSNGEHVRGCWALDFLLGQL